MKHPRISLSSSARSVLSDQQILVREHLLMQYRQLSELQVPLSQAAYLCGQRASVVTQHRLQAIEDILLRMQDVLHVGIMALDAQEIPCALRPYALLMRLRTLYRMTAEAQVTLVDISGLCKREGLHADPSGYFFRLYQQVNNLVRVYGSVLSNLQFNEVAGQPLQRLYPLPVVQQETHRIFA